VIAARETHLVELVSPSGEPIGSSTVEEAHTAPGTLHRAFSVVLHDGTGRMLLQQRAKAKTRFALRWANACCGHPEPGQSVVEAAARRMREELGVTGVNLTEAGIHVYAATDPATGRVEHEYDHVLIGRVDGNLTTDPDPAEVAALQWVSGSSLIAANDRYAPWLSGVLSVAQSSISVRDEPQSAG
jgi:isopentenyl-diphosphate delta-isomerase